MVKQTISAAQITAAAFEIMQTGGTVEQLSIRKIAAKLHIGVATFYWHFENKQASFKQWLTRLSPGFNFHQRRRLCLD